MNLNITKAGLLAAALLGAGLLGGWLIARQQAASTPPATAAGPAASAAKVLYWYDPMQPTQKFDKPGKSPFMDMQLVPRYAGEAEAEAAAGVAVSAQARQSLGLRLARVERLSLAGSVDALGVVQLNERELSLVQARSAGFVEQVFPLAAGDVLAAGAPLAVLLLPDWVAAQREYLALLPLGDAALSAAGRQRLQLLGMPEALIATVERSGQVQARYTVLAPRGGLLAELMVRQGMTVAAGQSLARINGLSSVWLEAAVPEAQAGALRPGQAAEVSLAALPGERLSGRVAAILPEADSQSRSLRVRIELANPRLRLRPGMSGQVRLSGTPRDALVLPAEAVIRTGRRAVVYLAQEEGRYQAVEVELGEALDDRLVIRRGLEPGQQVVASSQFLIDSEASLQGLPIRRLGEAGAAAAPPTVYQAQGVIEALDEAAVTLAHQPVAALRWPAMTMEFKLARPGQAQGLKPGQAVQFEFSRRGEDYELSTIRPQPAQGQAVRP